MCVVGLFAGPASAQQRALPSDATQIADWSVQTNPDAGGGELEVSGRVRLPNGNAPAQLVTLYVQDLAQTPPVVVTVRAASGDGHYRIPLSSGWWRVIPTAPDLVFDPAYRDYPVAPLPTAVQGFGNVVGVEGGN